MSLANKRRLHPHKFWRSSLRNKLVIGVVLLTAVGLIVAATVTYVEQRSFLYNKIDQQIKLAPVAIQQTFEYQQTLQTPQGDGPPQAPSPVSGPPAGSYGQLRDASGTVQATVAFRYGENIPATVNLPKKLPLNKPIDIGSYRVLAIPVKEITSSGTTTMGTIVAAIPLHDTEQTLNQLLLVETLVVIIILLLVGSVSWIFIRGGMRPLERFTETAERISQGDLSQRVEADERTEVGRLGSAFNTMLDNLQGAFSQRQRSEDRLRQFVADASHELRTPLTSIRGYAELSRIGAVDDPAEVMQRIEDEAIRMGVLVNNLLTLAKLDQMPEVNYTEVDVNEVITNTVKDILAASPDRQITAKLEDNIVISGDPHQLQQVMINLLKNAVLYTDGPIEVEAYKTEGFITISVKDHGPGLPEDADIVFERFWKAAEGRHDDNTGAGLGLSIVAAIVSAHGGLIKAENLPEGGAAFTLVLPADEFREALDDAKT